MINNSNIGLEGAEIESVNAILSQNVKIEQAKLFGSRAKGNYRSGSDVDIAIYGSQLSLNDVLDLSNDIEDLYLPYKFDIVIYNRITEPALKEHIDRVGIVLIKNV